MATFIKNLVPANWLVLEPERVDEATESTWDEWDASVAALESQGRIQGASSARTSATDTPRALAAQTSS